VLVPLVLELLPPELELLELELELEPPELELELELEPEPLELELPLELLELELLELELELELELLELEPLELEPPEPEEVPPEPPPHAASNRTGAAIINREVAVSGVGMDMGMAFSFKCSGQRLKQDHGEIVEKSVEFDGASPRANRGP
jgi:hypothetical protein